MAYFLLKLVLAHNPKIEIGSSEFEEIARAWDSIAVIVDMEEEWDSLIQNYVELEMDLLKAAMQSMVFRHEAYHEMHQQRLGFARRLSNLLQTCRSYIDHAPHHLGKLGDCDFQSVFDELRKKAHSEHFGYRFMDAMRNYAQHRGVPLHGSTWNAQWIGDVGNDLAERRLRYIVTARVDVQKVRQDKKFKAAVREEIEGLDHLDVVGLTREYIEALGWIHSELRGIMNDVVVGWKDCVRNAIARYAQTNNGNVIGLAAVELSEDGDVIRKVDIFEDLLHRQEYLARRNGDLINLRRRFVSNELLPPKSNL